MNDTHDHGPSSEMADSGADWRSWNPSRRRFLTLTGLAVGGAVSASAPRAAAPRRPGTAPAAGEARAVPARPGRRCSWPASSGVRRRASTRSRLRPTGRRAQAARASSSTRPCCGSTCWTARCRRAWPRRSQQPDDHTIVLPLQDGTKWSDGSDLTADDVVFTFELGKTAPVTFSTVWQYIDSVTATDPTTVEFKLKTEPVQPDLRQELPRRPSLIVPKAVFSKISPDKIPSETNLQADRFRSVQAGQVRPDPGQPDAGRQLLGQGRLRHRRR